MSLFKLEDVASVYSGINGRCCCGCAGKYSYSEQHRNWSTKDRGYQVGDDEVSDRSVKIIAGKLLRAEESVNKLGDGLFTLEVGNRLLMVKTTERKK